MTCLEGGEREQQNFSRKFSHHCSIDFMIMWVFIYFVYYRQKQVHRKTVEMFPGNNIPIFRGNQNAKRRLDKLAENCKEQLNPDIGYDEGNIYETLPLSC